VIDIVPGLAEAIIAKARRYRGRMVETDGPNDGPEIREWLSARGIHVPAAWCAAFACAQAREAAADLQVTLAFRGSAGALRLLDLNPDLVVAEPEPGALVIWDHGHGKGHAGIVTGVTRVDRALAEIDVIAGNTNADGSRDANMVWERSFPQPDGARKIAGYIRIT
jgi:hypothetical protein